MGNSFFTMEYTLGDILMIVGYVGGIIATYIVISNRITRLEVKQEAFREKISELQMDIRSNKSAIDQEKRFVLEKLAILESGQSKTNVFLEENLKRLTEILAMHDTRLKDQGSKIDDHSKALNDLYRLLDNRPNK